MPAPIRPGAPAVPSTVNAPASTTPTAPSVPAAPAAPTTWGANAGPAPKDQFGALAGRATAALGQALQSSRPSDFDLVPGRTPGAVSLPSVLQQLGSSPQGQAAVKQVMDQLQAATGRTFPPAMTAAVMANPAALTNAMEVTPGELSQGLTALNAAHTAGKVKDVAPRAFALPQKFDFANLGATTIPNPQPQLKEVAPGLYTGSLPSQVPEAQLKQNRAVAEVFQRLANNPSAAAGQKFEVTYGGKAFTKLDDFMGALKADGYSVQVGFDSRVANFADLKAAVPGTNPPQFVDVPAPLMVKTGQRDAQGREAVVPVAHSEMTISLHAGPATKGPRLDADVKFYQGISGTGFFPCHTSADPAWCGHVTHATVKGDQALDCVKLAGHFTDVVHTAAAKAHLYAEGYGLTGVCNDSVAVVQQAVLGRADQYPLLMQDARLTGALKAKLADGDKSDDAALRRLSKAIADLPSDARPNPSSQRRALASLPWAKGQEPFASSEQARRILGG